MRHHHSRRHNPRRGLIFGIAILTIGVASLLDTLNVFDFHNLLHFWPAIFFIIGVAKLARARRPVGIFNGLALIGLSIGLTLNEMGIIHLDWKIFWPLLFIVIGVNLLLKSFFPSDYHPKFEFDQITTDDNSIVKNQVFLGGAKIVNHSQDFKGGYLSATMGGIELDLRNAQITGEAQLEVQVQFGGVEIKIPNDWIIVNRAVATMGAVEDKTRPPVHSEKRLIITGNINFGAVEIRN